MKKWRSDLSLEADFGTLNRYLAVVTAMYIELRVLSYAPILALLDSTNDFFSNCFSIENTLAMFSECEMERDG